MTRAEALRSPTLYLLILAMFAMTASSCIQPHLPSLLGGMDFSTGQVSVMVSVMTASLALGKILQGLLYSKLGIFKGSVIMLVLFAVSYLLLCSSRTVYPGLVTLAFGLGTITTLLPTVTRAILGSKEYPAIWSIISTTNSVSAFLMTPLWGMVYDTTGSYRLALILSPILIAISLVALLVAFSKSKK
jgi:MFS family permease